MSRDTRNSNVVQQGFNNYSRCFMRDRLFHDLQDLLDRYSNMMPVHDRVFVVGIVRRKLTEGELEDSPSRR